jgi:putative nucleotidyltransferase with HDIG domain
MAASDAPPSPTPGRAEPPTVLVVDDERGPRESLRMILEPHHRVLQAGNATDALEIVRSRPVDLVTLDLKMPGMSGETVMRTLRREFPQVEVIVITGCGSIESAAEGVRAGICDYLQKPFDVVQVGAAVSRALSRRAARVRLTRFLEQLGTVVGRDRDVLSIVQDVERSHRMRARLSNLFDATVRDAGEGVGDVHRSLELLEVLAETIEAKDRFMRGHARRVAVYAGLLAERIGLPSSEQELVRIAAFLHDVGKVGVPTQLLLREGALDPGERAIVEEHPEIGARLVEPLDVAPAISQALRHHHEWWNGTGYPDGIAGEAIPLIARIVSVADAFDAMSCDRPYRRALARPVILSEFERFGGVQFDPELCKAFLAVITSGADELDAQLVADAVADARTSLAS